MPPVKTVGVISTGVIGSSFVALFLSYGLHVLVCSPSGSPGSEAKLAANLERIWLTLDPATLAHGASLSNYTFVGASLDGYYDEVDFVQENAPENLELKRRLLAEIDAGLATRPEVVIATSSSGLLASTLVTKCAHHPERVLVGHPYNPPHLIPLVEVVPHPQTDPAASEGAVDFYRFLGRQPVLVKKETPGFVANRLQAVLMREAFSLVLNGVVSAEEVGMYSSMVVGRILSVSLERVKCMFLLTRKFRSLCDRSPWSPMGLLRSLHDECPRGWCHEGRVQTPHQSHRAGGARLVRGYGRQES